MKTLLKTVCLSTLLACSTQVLADDENHEAKGNNPQKFQQHQQKIIQKLETRHQNMQDRFNKRMQILNQLIDCVKTAKARPDLKQCKSQSKAARAEIKKAH